MNLSEWHVERLSHPIAAHGFVVIIHHRGFGDVVSLGRSLRSVVFFFCKVFHLTIKLRGYSQIDPLEEQPKPVKDSHG